MLRLLLALPPPLSPSRDPEPFEDVAHKDHPHPRTSGLQRLKGTWNWLSNFEVSRTSMSTKSMIIGVHFWQPLLALETQTWWQRSFCGERNPTLKEASITTSYSVVRILVA